MSETGARAKVAVIIEDNADVQSLLEEVFRAAGFEPIVVGSGLEGVAAVEKYKPVITTLDVNLPGIDGFEAARRIRKVSATFIIMLSALAEESDVVLGLTSGADEYLVKPFRPRELRARIEALMRRPVLEAPAPVADAVKPAVAARNPIAAATAAVPIIDSGTPMNWQAHRDVSIDLDTHTVLVAQKEVDLTPTEFDLLATLLESKRRVRSKSDLALVLRGESFGAYYVGEPDKRAIEAHMANLRRKIGDNPTEPRYIETVRGVGYRLTPVD